MKNNIQDQDNQWPVLALKNTTLFPGTIIPIRAMRNFSVEAIERAIRNGGTLITVSENEENSSTSEKLFEQSISKTGTLTRIEKHSGNKKQGYNLILHGLSRVSIDSLLKTDKHYSALANVQDDLMDLDSENQRLVSERIQQTSKKLFDMFPENTDAIQEQLSSIQDLPLLTHVCLAHLELDFEERISFLENRSVQDRALKLLQLLESKIQELETKNEFQQRWHARLEKKQTGDRKSRNSIDYRKKIKESGMTEEIMQIAMDELDRMESMGSGSHESGMIRNYLDLMISLPWKSEGDSISNESIDLELARSILNEDHDGLDEVKKKILQCLAVSKLKKTNRGQILLLVGPPGVGKTSLGQSIARAMNRKFTRVALGGVRDEAEIRGHRRTYVGSMPGRIIQAIKRTGSKEAVILLDEIDKISRNGYQGDPTAALLEVLDPEQNSNFTDHYLDVPYDLSKIVFIATANTVETIPGPLLDRMDLIEISGYTATEKVQIARRHLIPKIMNELGIGENQVQLEDDVLKKTIQNYTREAGVRDLNRKLGTLYRSITEKVVSGKVPFPIILGWEELENSLGKERFESETAEKTGTPGVATGLAWTPMGGEILFIESGLMPGKGNLILTGQLGEVMQESAQIALSLLRSNLSSSVSLGDFESRDIHVHVPAGAIPKDGPSAGITMLSSLASSFLNQPIDPQIGMTGEITLRGVVLPVGGIKEKMIAAHQAGLKKIVLSKKNERDLKELPEEVLQGLEFRFVEKVSELISEVFGKTIGIPQAAPANAETVGDRIASLPLM